MPHMIKTNNIEWCYKLAIKKFVSTNTYILQTFSPQMIGLKKYDWILHNFSNKTVWNFGHLTSRGLFDKES